MSATDYINTGPGSWPKLKQGAKVCVRYEREYDGCSAVTEFDGVVWTEPDGSVTLTDLEQRP